jgi:hypothetical protein
MAARDTPVSSARAIAAPVGAAAPDYVIPDQFDDRVAAAVATQARADGAARR